LNEQQFFNLIIYIWFAIAAGVFIILFFITAPYGRHARSGWGPTIPNKIGWIIMEAPASLVFAAFFLLSLDKFSFEKCIFLVLWESHYIHRAFIYPAGLHDNGKRMPLMIAIMAIIFNGMNGYLNSRYLFEFSTVSGFITSPHFIIGSIMFICGFIINRHSDHILAGLRAPGETGYKIPRGGLYRWITCPNYFGEIVEWTGWAVLTWSLPGLAFAVWTAANLVPRARTHHEWYKGKFPEYPSDRKALLPYLW
jgi:3-oxo-5-alpha-steroid 4-dehydrogenase 1